MGNWSWKLQPTLSRHTKMSRMLVLSLNLGRFLSTSKTGVLRRNLSQENYKHISAYLIHLLSTEENKAMIMGSIYKARLMNRINNNEMLRLCSVVARAFLPDLKSLPDYLEENTNISIEAQSIINLGLIDNFLGGEWTNHKSCCLNGTGKLFHDILSESGWL